MAKQIVMTLMVVTAASSQTRVDLRSQAKSVDFRSAAYTRPLAAGTVLPAACTQGDLFFLVSAAPGSNIVLCSSPNTWITQNALTLSNNGTVLASRSVLNLVPGFGFSTVAVDTGSQINLQQTVDSAMLMTAANHQSGQALLCASASGSATAYTCSMTPTLTAYRTGMVLDWIPDVNGAGGATTLNIDTLGSKPVKLADGATDTLTGDIAAGRLVPMWYDGAVFRTLTPQGITISVSSNMPPGCDASSRGRVWHYASPSGTQDRVSVCAKDAADSYAWRTLY